MKKATWVKLTCLSALLCVLFGVLVFPVAKLYRVDVEYSWRYPVLLGLYTVVLGINQWGLFKPRKRNWILSTIVIVCALELCWRLLMQTLYWRDMLQLGFATDHTIFVRYAVCTVYSAVSFIALPLMGYVARKKGKV